MVAERESAGNGYGKALEYSLRRRITTANYKPRVPNREHSPLIGLLSPRHS
jgi:hypothetical protein